MHFAYYTIQRNESLVAPDQVWHTVEFLIYYLIIDFKYFQKFQTHLE